MTPRHCGFSVAMFQAALLLSISSLQAEVRLPAIFSDHMVLQQNQHDRIWGWADPGEEVTVTLGQQSHSVRADKEGRWLLELDPLPAGGPFTMVVKAQNEIRLDDVWSGEVWICSGQSNMELPEGSANDADLEALSARYPRIR